jgi:hypothetical protein
MTPIWAEAAVRELPAMTTNIGRFIAELYGASGKTSESIKLKSDFFTKIKIMNDPMGSQAILELSYIITGAQLKPDVIIWPLSNILPFIDSKLVKEEKGGLYVPAIRSDIVLYCIVLYCIVLYCIVLYCIVLYCIVLYCIVMLNNARGPSAKVTKTPVNVLASLYKYMIKNSTASFDKAYGIVTNNAY